MGDIYGMMTIVGPVLLLIVLGWVMLNNRRSKADEQRTEEATRRMYEEQERADEAGER